MNSDNINSDNINSDNIEITGKITNNMEDDSYILLNTVKKHTSFTNLTMCKKKQFISEFDNIIKTAKNGLWYIPNKELHIIYPNFAGGSFSTIHDCKWRGSNIVVKKPIRNNINNLMEFLKEIQICSTLRHPNLVQFLGISFNSTEILILFEKIIGSNLEDFINNKNSMLSSNIQKHITSQLITTFKFLHNCNPPIIYRDLKPANILIDKTICVKLTDFGLSKYFQNETNEAYLLSGETGTIRYMAPEVFNNQKYNLKVDVYSLGLIIYFIYTMTKPFNEYTVDSMKFYFQQEDLILSTNKIKSKNIQNIVNKCINKNPQERIDINELLIAWDLYLTHNGSKKFCIIG